VRRQRLSISLSESELRHEGIDRNAWEDFVERLVTEGRYHSAEQVVSAGLSLVARREAKLNKLRDVIEASIAAGGTSATKS
jgi:putative addiction module CopG family antidote